MLVCKKQEATHKRNSSNKVVLDRRIVLEDAHVHAKESHQERQGQEDEGYPAESPKTSVELERLARVADADGFVHLDCGQPGRPMCKWEKSIKTGHGSLSRNFVSRTYQIDHVLCRSDKIILDGDAGLSEIS